MIFRGGRLERLPLEMNLPSTVVEKRVTCSDESILRGETSVIVADASVRPVLKPDKGLVWGGTKSDADGLPLENTAAVIEVCIRKGGDL